VTLIEDLPALDVLGAVDARTLAACHHAVGSRTVLHALNASLPALKVGRLARGELPLGDTLVDALLLVGLAGVDARRRLSQGEAGRADDQGGGE
jgi:hypothetical protein